MFIKKGAMFGLDARIALAIFGALSVISGAALYSAIQESRVTAYLTEMNELGKAWEQYYLDTGESLPVSGVYGVSANLVDKPANVNGWKGPYVNYESNGNQLYAKGNASLLRHFVYYAEDYSGACTATDCFVWVRFDMADSELDIIKAIDKRIDGTEGASAGKLVYFNDSAGQNQKIMLLNYAPHKI